MASTAARRRACRPSLSIPPTASTSRARTFIAATPQAGAMPRLSGAFSAWRSTPAASITRSPTASASGRSQFCRTAPSAPMRDRAASPARGRPQRDFQNRLRRSRRDDPFRTRRADRRFRFPGARATGDEPGVALPSATTRRRRPATWQAEPDEYAIGFAAALRNANGGVAIGSGYRPDGSLDSGACGVFLWTTGEQLRVADDPALAAELAASGPLPLNGLQGNAIEKVRPDNVPPLQSYFANYFDDSGNPAFHGHLGDIAIPRSCAQSAFVLPTPVTAIAGWPAPSACPPDFTSFDGLCQAPRCPPGHGGGVQCCPQGTAPGANGECEPLRGGNLGCPIGAAALRGSDGSIRCAWLARCPEGAQADLRGGCERVCPPGETAWRSRKCCGYGEVGLPDGQCCPERDVRDGKCVQACPEGAVRMPDGQCCPRQDVHDGKCTQACPEGAVRMPDGQCCPRQDVHDGKCVQACPEGAIRLPNGECCTRQDVRDGKCVQACPEGAVRMPGGECCPRQDVRDGHCVSRGLPGGRHPPARRGMLSPAGRARRQVRQQGLPERPPFACPMAQCCPRAGRARRQVRQQHVPGRRNSVCPGGEDAARGRTRTTAIACMPAIPAIIPRRDVA